MSLWLLITITTINMLSLLALIIIHRHLDHLSQSHIRVLGRKSKDFIIGTKRKLLKHSYTTITIILIGGSYLFFLNI